MPPGLYEVWPISSSMPPPSGKAPLILAAQPGMNVAEITIANPGS
jgi:hypothetical protein